MCFTPLDGSGRGGRHVELGYALALDKSIWLVGRREHIFHSLPQVKHFDSWDSAFQFLRSTV